MKPTTILIPQFFLLAATHAAPGANNAKSCAKGIQWAPCDEKLEALKNAQLPIECATVTVPLDYTVRSCNETIRLNLLRVPARAKPSKGSILFNFGGPGDAGRASMALKMQEFTSIVGAEYDLVAFDPRGTVDTLTMTCSHPDELAAYMMSSPTYANTSDTAPGQIWTTQGTVAHLCKERNHMNGSYVGTAFTARDLITVVDALGEDGMLRFWGLSYGTVLGATVAAMFPDRIHRMVLDGVVNAHEYYSSFDEESQIMADESFSGFFKACVDAPNSACPLNRHNVSAAVMETQFWDTVLKIKFEPLRIGAAVVDYAAIKNAVILTLYGPRNFPLLAKALDDLYNGNLTTILTQFTGGDAEGAVTPEANQAIQCSDKAASLRTSNQTHMTPIIAAKYNRSRITGDSRVFADMACAQWLMEAKERYQGNFHVKTKNPLLFIGNTYDTVSPYQSAVNMSAGFEGSSAIEQNSYGHGSSAQPSICTIKAIRQYLASGALPPRGTKCEPYAPLFAEQNVTKVVQVIDGKE